jgi:hypothetical protein
MGDREGENSSDETEMTVALDAEPPSDVPSELLSPASQIGRAAQSGGTRESGPEPGDEARHGWPMPDQGDTPPEWPEPTADD